ncbi:MAG TPA: DegQ family serine endoprotease [Thiobacillaceae bacterium]|nr:DegQ family serine endoprotease [Thiobacillaceae bacterium]
MKSWFTWLVLSFGLATAATAASLPDFTELAEKQSAAVVNIATTQEGRKSMRRGRMPEPEEMFDFFRRFMPPEGERFMPPKRGQGSGFIISGDGYILTNAHVVDDVDEVVVKLNDKREFRAKVIGTDPRTDVALLRINADKLPRVVIGDPGRLKVGEWVLAIGAPFGFENSVTAGIVSAKGRSLPQENYVPFIQTDVAVNPGNSGGPLFNMNGEVVGINSQIISRSGGYMGLSFAIPIDVAMDVAEQLKGGGKVNRGRLGVLIQEVSADLAESFGLKSPQGALVSEVEPGSPADKGGLQPSDIILKFNGRDVQSSIDLPRMVGATKPGTKTTVTVWRKGVSRELDVVVGEMADEKVAQAADERKANRAGLVVSELKKEQLRELKIDAGVLVEDVSGAAARAGIRPGDVVVAVNNHGVSSAADLDRLLNDTKRKTAAVLVKRGEGSLYIPLRLD